MPTDNDGHWMDLYRAALLEVDIAMLPGRIEQARLAIQAYMESFGATGIDRDQHRLLTDALRNLEVLRREIE